LIIVDLEALKKFYTRMSIYQIGALGDSEDMLNDTGVKKLVYKDILKLAE